MSTQISQADRLLTPAEVADRLAVSVKTVRRWAKAGILDPILVVPGGHPRYRQRDIERLIDEGGRT